MSYSIFKLFFYVRKMPPYELLLLLLKILLWDPCALKTIPTIVPATSL